MGKPIRIGHSESTLTLAEIGNLNLLLWESVDKDGNSFSAISLMGELI